LNIFLALIGGVVVNTCGYIRQEGYESFKHIAKTFDGKKFKIKRNFSEFLFLIS